MAPMTKSRDALHGGDTPARYAGIDAAGAVAAVWFSVPTDARVFEMRRALAG